MNGSEKNIRCRVSYAILSLIIHDAMLATNIPEFEASTKCRGVKILFTTKPFRRAIPKEIYLNVLDPEIPQLKLIRYFLGSFWEKTIARSVIFLYRM